MSKVEEQMVLMQDSIEKNDRRLTRHLAEYERHRVEEVEWRVSHMQAMSELTTSLRDLTASSKDIIDAWVAADGAMKTLSTVGKLVKWLAGIGITVAAATAWFKGF